MRVFAICLLCLLLVTVQAVAEDKKLTELETETQKISYAVGMQMGSYLKTLGEDLDSEILIQGLKDSYSGTKFLLTREEQALILKKITQKRRDREKKGAPGIIAKNKKAAEDFLKENGTKKGVKTTDSGLQYKVITQGYGPKPKAEDIVKVHYKGTLLDGTEFESTYTRKDPAVFPLDKVIPGWTEAIQLMNVGSKFQLFLPPDLAYGDRGAPPVIEPGSMLIFEVELLSIGSEPTK